MPTQGERQKFLWRPNDNSSTTLTRYDLEAEHWVRAFKSAEMKSKPADLGAIFGVIGMVISLIINIIWIIGYLLRSFIIWAFDLNNKKSHKKVETLKYTTPQVDFENTAREKKVRQILKNRPSVFGSTRHKLFMRAALAVILKQKVSISTLIYELKTDFETVSKLIDQLYEAGIISGIKSDTKRKVLIEDKVSLDLLLNLEKQYSEI